MSQQAIIKRYSIIIGLLNKRQYPSRDEIIEKFELEGFNCSRSTFNRTLESLRDEFGVEVTYSAHKRGYFIDEEKSLGSDSFSNLLNYYSSNENLSQAFSVANESIKYIQIDSSFLMKGLEHLSNIVFAINKCKQVQLTYRKFNSVNSETFKFNPEILKEYLNRWYMVGFTHHRNNIRTYALDRIESIIFTEDDFERHLGKADDYFKDVIGINTSGKKIMDIVLSFKVQQGNYIRTLPLHHSQRTLIDNNKEFRITLKLKPNYELKQRILMYGDDVEIIEPKNLFELC